MNKAGREIKVLNGVKASHLLPKCLALLLGARINIAGTEVSSSILGFKTTRFAKKLAAVKCGLLQFCTLFLKLTF